jgi:tRNA(Ile)-lysidine synthase
VTANKELPEAPLPQRIAVELKALGAAPPYVVAFSGGLDSTALLAAVPGARAVHVNHQLHADAARWQQHCAKVAQRLGRRFAALTIEVDRDLGHGLESAARQARYAALIGALQPGETLLTAHHANDQNETLLLRLLRGAGLSGLRGITPKRALGGERWLVRPLLTTPRAALQAYLDTQQLPIVTDPSNVDLAHDRNYLRAEILPRLHSRWPQLNVSFAHSIAALDGTHTLLREQLLQRDPQQLRNWQPLSLPARSALLSTWIHALGLPPPRAAQLNEFARQLDADSEAQPKLVLGTHALRRYREVIHAVPSLPPITPFAFEFDGHALDLPQALGRLWITPLDRARAPLRVSAMQPGAALRLRANGPRQQLRTLLQAHAVPPWQRLRLPLLYLGDDLIGVGDLLQSDALKNWLGEATLHFSA